MNKTVTGTGKTVEDAINHGLQQLGVTKNKLKQRYCNCRTVG